MSKVIEAHDTKITSVLGIKKGELPKYEYPIYFGIELECEVETPPDLVDDATKHLYRSQVAERIQHTYKDFAFAKHDGSMFNGFEVVSIPLSRDAHATRWIPFLEAARENGLQIRNSCGMHVHVSREWLTPLQIGKMLAFVCNPKNEDFMKIIAGRKPPVIKSKNYPDGKAYAEMSPKKITDVTKHRDRYSALNLVNPETIEFRIFKGTLNLHILMKNIEFCDALVRFTWPSGNVSIRDIKENGLKAFFDFVNTNINRKRFPFLAQFLREHNCIKWKVKKPSKIGLAKITEMQAEKEQAELEQIAAMVNQTEKKKRRRVVKQKALPKVKGKVMGKKLEVGKKIHMDVEGGMHLDYPVQFIFNHDNVYNES